MFMNRTAIYFEGLPYGGALEIGLGILSSPVLAFRFAQVWERAKSERIDPFDKMSRRRFAWWLLFLTRIEGIQDPPALIEEASSLKALDIYLETVFHLLKQWRACDQDPVRWWKETTHVEDVRRVQKAVASTSFVLECVRGYRGAQPKPLWASMAGELIPAPAVLMAAKPMKKREREQYENIYGPAWDQEPNAPLRVVKSKPFMRAGPFTQAEQALGAAARKMAYLLFSEVLVQGLRVQFCLRRSCGAAFLYGKKQKYCSKQCGHIDSGLQSKKAALIDRNRIRVREASKAIAAWMDSGAKGDWRGSVEKALLKKYINGISLISGTSKSHWLGRCIRTAGSPQDSPQRARLVELCTGPKPSEENLKKISKDLNAFYASIRQAQDRTRRFKAKHATTRAANAARRPGAALK
jgi:hypothetical protein